MSREAREEMTGEEAEEARGLFKKQVERGATSIKNALEKDGVPVVWGGMAALNVFLEVMLAQSMDIDWMRETFQDVLVKYADLLKEKEGLNG